MQKQTNLIIPAPSPGVYVPVPTFFTSKKCKDDIIFNASLGVGSHATAVDLQAQAEYSVYLARSGITGQILLGTTGEAISVSDEERIAMLTCVWKELEAAGFKDYPLMAGTASQDVDRTVKLLHDAERCHIKWGLVLAPGFFGPLVSQDGICEWYEAVARLSPIPILIYHYPAVSNNLYISPKTFEKLSQHPNIVGTKLSHGDITIPIRICSSPSLSSSFTVFTGLGQLLIPFLAVGGQGTIDALAGVFPRTLIHLYRLWEQADGRPTPEMRELQRLWTSGEEIVAKYGTTAIKEAVSRLHGWGDADGTRPPLRGGLPEGVWDAMWKDSLAALEAKEKELTK